MPLAAMTRALSRRWPRIEFPVKSVTITRTGSTGRKSRSPGITRDLSCRGANIVFNYPFSSLKNESEAVGREFRRDWVAACADIASDERPAELVRQVIAKFGHF